MLEMIDRVWLWLFVRVTVWRRHHRPCTSADLTEAFTEARCRFPNDQVQREVRAKAELFLRELLGQRKLDA